MFLILFLNNHQWKVEYIRLTKMSDMCFCSVLGAACVCSMIKLDWNVIGRAAMRIILLLKPSVLYLRKCFCNQCIHSNYRHWSRLFIWARPSFHTRTYTQSEGQRSDFHPHVSYYYFQSNYQDVKGFIWSWIHMSKVKSWIWRRSFFPDSLTCTH